MERGEKAGAIASGVDSPAAANALGNGAYKFYKSISYMFNVAARCRIELAGVRQITALRDSGISLHLVELK
jgi:hypothetical protein